MNIYNDFNLKVEKAVQASETDLRHKSIVKSSLGHHQHSRHGLGYIKSPKVPSDKSSRRMMNRDNKSAR